ncbi:serine/arginine repetitive matrix protein 1-like, partial [Uloborus diversus]|uniref:serine/arginine repetitive matrix protein 1-like n=1 Tax=Uloborus diversus TaxID=327109 RepID=UPI002409550F
PAPKRRRPEEDQAVAVPVLKQQKPVLRRKPLGSNAGVPTAQRKRRHPEEDELPPPSQGAPSSAPALKKRHMEPIAGPSHLEYVPKSILEGIHDELRQLREKIAARDQVLAELSREKADLEARLEERERRKQELRRREPKTREPEPREPVPREPEPDHDAASPSPALDPRLELRTWRWSTSSASSSPRRSPSPGPCPDAAAPEDARPDDAGSPDNFAPPAARRPVAGDVGGVATLRRRQRLIPPPLPQFSPASDRRVRRPVERYQAPADAVPRRPRLPPPSRRPRRILEKGGTLKRMSCHPPSAPAPKKRHMEPIAGPSHLEFVPKSILEGIHAVLRQLREKIAARDQVLAESEKADLESRLEERERRRQELRRREPKTREPVPREPEPDREAVSPSPALDPRPELRTWRWSTSSASSSPQGSPLPGPCPDVAALDDARPDDAGSPDNFAPPAARRPVAGDVEDVATLRRASAPDTAAAAAIRAGVRPASEAAGGAVPGARRRGAAPPSFAAPEQAPAPRPCLTVKQPVSMPLQQEDPSRNDDLSLRLVLGWHLLVAVVLIDDSFIEPVAGESQVQCLTVKQPPVSHRTCVSASESGIPTSKGLPGEFSA